MPKRPTRALLRRGHRLVAAKCTECNNQTASTPSVADGTAQEEKATKTQNVKSFFRPSRSKRRPATYLNPFADHRKKDKCLAGNAQPTAQNFFFLILTFPQAEKFTPQRVISAAAHRLLVGPRRNGRETASSTARRLHSFHPTRTGNPRPRNKSFLLFFPFLFLFLVTPLPYSDVLLVPVTTRKRNISPNNQRRGLAFPLAASGVVRPFDFCFLARYTSEHSSFFF